MKRFLTFIVLLLAFSFSTEAQYVYGKIIDDEGKGLAFVSVQIKGTSVGTTTNQRGNYKLSLVVGEYDLTFKSLGFEEQEHRVKISSQSPKELNITLIESSTSLGEVDVVANKRDLAKEIMSEVRSKRGDYLKNIESYSCKTYAKISVEHEVNDTIESEIKDSVTGETTPAVIETKRGTKELIETASTIYFRSPNNYKEYFEAYQDYSDMSGLSRWIGGGASVTIGVEYGEQSFVPEGEEHIDRLVLYTGIHSTDLNFYENTIDYTRALIKPLLSPIAATSALSYVYDYMGNYFDEDKKIHHIKVTPIFKQDALFNGLIHIQDSTWALVKVELNINKDALDYANELKIIQEYKEVAPNIYLPEKRELFYTIKEGKKTYWGDVNVFHKNYTVNQPIKNDFALSEQRKYDDNAFERDSSFWEENRLLELKEQESGFIHEKDSLRDYYASEEYMKKQDSLFNKISWWLPLAGYQRRNSYKGYEWGIGGLFEQINPFGIGGYRHRLPVYFTQVLKNGMRIETDADLDYGFRNQDLRGDVGAGWTYFPKKSIRTYLKFGNYYRTINPNASFTQVFSRSNFVNVKSVLVKQRMEVFNGLYAELSVDYADQIPITGLELAPWTDSLFGDLNNPTNFQRYTKTEIRLNVEFRPFQEFTFKRNRKIAKPSGWPTFRGVYRKGIPGIFNSEVNFDYVELSVSDEINLARLGTSRWNAYVGSFVNQNSLRVLEYKFFRGSDRGFFSDPLWSFQLLGPVVQPTPNEYFQASYIHHFDGAILGKIPLLSRLKLQLAGGAGTLAIPDSNFAHAEFYAGIERPTKMWGDLVRWSVWLVTAKNPFTTGVVDYTVKFGFSFYSQWREKWDW